MKKKTRRTTNADPRVTARELVDGLARVEGENLRAALLHGSVARGEAVPGVSDVNVLVLLDDAGPPVLQRLALVAREWHERAGTPPLLLTRAEWTRAADVFAIEVSDMRDAREMLHGDDPVAELAVDPTELRLQTERELRGKLLQLREGALLAAASPDELGWLLGAALPSFAAFMRAALRLERADVPAETSKLIARAAETMGDADPEPLQRVWAARREGRTLQPDMADPLVAGYYDFAERLADHVDRLP